MSQNKITPSSHSPAPDTSTDALNNAHERVIKLPDPEYPAVLRSRGKDLVMLLSAHNSPYWTCIY